MKEIGSSYFSAISKLVNSRNYNIDGANNRLSNEYRVTGLNSLKLIEEKIKKSGFCVVKNEYHSEIKKPLNIDELFSTIFGSLIREKNPRKEKYANVQAEKGGRYYINSNLAQPMHTDEGHTNQYPRYIILSCLKQSKTGGESILVKFNDLYIALLQQFGELVNSLFDTNAITVQNTKGIDTKPILINLERGEIGISYSPVLQKMWCKTEIFEVFDFITAYVHDMNNQIRFKLEPNEILLMDNCKVLHGRTMFKDTSERILHRYWFGGMTYDL